MKNNGDVAQEWITKAESDFAAAGLCINGAVALDTATFHCEQAVEKSLKAWLIAHDIDPPKTHELKELIALCTSVNSRFGGLVADADALTPYAVKLRQDAKFWPSIEEARDALDRARRIYDFVKEHWS